MGGLCKQMPFAFWAMRRRALDLRRSRILWILLSKDAVIYGALEHGHPWLDGIGVDDRRASPRTICSACSSSRSWASIAGTSIRASWACVIRSWPARRPGLRRRRGAPRAPSRSGLADERAGCDPDGSDGADRRARFRWRQHPVGQFFAPLFGEQGPTVSTPPVALTEPAGVVLIVAGFSSRTCAMPRPPRWSIAFARRERDGAHAAGVGERVLLRCGDRGAVRQARRKRWAGSCGPRRSDA